MLVLIPCYFVIFPCKQGFIREFALETGSLETAPTTTLRLRLRVAGHPFVACRAKASSGVGVSPEAPAKERRGTGGTVRLMELARIRLTAPTDLPRQSPQMEINRGKRDSLAANSRPC